MTTKIDNFRFANLADLREWLNDFNCSELEAIHPNSGEFFVLDWFEEILSDGSRVFNADINTPDLTDDEFKSRLAAIK